MSDGDAMLLALVRRKGNAHALADWLLENRPERLIPPVPMRDTDAVVACACKSRTLAATVSWVVVEDEYAWLRFVLQWGPVDAGGRRKDGKHDISQMIHVVWPTAHHWLPKYLNQTFIRRR